MTSEQKKFSSSFKILNCEAMVLIVDPCTQICTAIALPELYSAHPKLLEEAKKFARVPPRIVQPVKIQ